MIQADASGRFVIHADLGMDKIYVWKFDEQHGGLAPNDPPSVSLPPAMVHAISISIPMDAGCTPCRRKAPPSPCSTTTRRSGRLSLRQTISTLPPGFAGSNFCSEILVSADGSFVYAGNRLHDSIGIFSVGPTGA